MLANRAGDTANKSSTARENNTLLLFVSRVTYSVRISILSDLFVSIISSLCVLKLIKPADVGRYQFIFHTLKEFSFNNNL